MITNRLVLIDAFALIHRAFHAIPPLTTKDGQLVNAVYGFTSALLSAIKDLRPEYLAVGIDLPKPTHRHQEYAQYKAHRPKTPDELKSQIPYVKEVLRVFNIPVFGVEGYEGEDVLATIVAKCKLEMGNGKLGTSKNPHLTSHISNSPLETIIVTGDMDVLQLIDEDTKVYSMARGVNQAIMYDLAKVKEKYGLTPEEFVDFKALKGDQSDNIPGVPGIGEKTACKLIQEFGSLEKLYETIKHHTIERHSELAEESPANAGSAIRRRSFANAQDDIKKMAKKLKISEKVIRLLLENKEQAFLSRKLSKIVSDAPLDFSLEDARVHDYDKDKVIKLFNQLGFKSLIARLPNSNNSIQQAKLL